MARPGRPKKSSLERLIPRVWYYAVRARSGLKDADLDVKFLHGSDEIRRAKADRIRAFESIRSNGTMPSHGRHRKRPYNLVDLVDEDEACKGTKKIITSPFWKLLLSPPHDLQGMTKLVAECTVLLNLERLAGKDVIHWIWINNPLPPVGERMGLRKDGVSDYEVHLQQAAQHLPSDLDTLALFGAMYQEACLSFQPVVAETLGGYFNISLMELCSQDWLKPIGPYLEDVARNRILHGLRDYIPDAPKLEQNPILMTRSILVRKDDPTYQQFIDNADIHETAMRVWVGLNVEEKQLAGMNLTETERKVIAAMRAS